MLSHGHFNVETLPITTVWTTGYYTEYSRHQRMGIDEAVRNAADIQLQHDILQIAYPSERRHYMTYDNVRTNSASQAATDRAWIAQTNLLHRVLQQTHRADHRLLPCCRPTCAAVVQQEQCSCWVTSSTETEDQRVVSLHATASHLALPEPTSTNNKQTHQIVTFPSWCCGHIIST